MRRGLGTVRFLLLGLLGAVLVACGGGPSATGTVSPGASEAPSPPSSPSVSPTATTGGVTELTVLAASSLTDALPELAAAYEATHPGVRIALSFDSTSALRARVEAGAAADVLASADTTTPAALAGSGLATGTPLTFAANALALVVPTANPAGIRDPYDLERPGLRIVAAGPAVPLTAYVEQVISNLQAYRGAQAEFPRIYEENVVSREENARAVLAKIELGEGDAAFVYATDARASGRVTEIPLPEGTNVVAPYAAVALAASAHPAEAADLVAWLGGGEAARILARFGFLPAP